MTSLSFRCLKLDEMNPTSKRSTSLLSKKRDELQTAWVCKQPLFLSGSLYPTGYQPCMDFTGKVEGPRSPSMVQSTSLASSCGERYEAVPFAAATSYGMAGSSSDSCWICIPLVFPLHALSSLLSSSAS